jgi:hypothetical protein
MNARLRPDGTLSRDGRFRWSAGWGKWVPTGKEQEPELDLAPLGAGPLEPEIERHPFDGCAECMNQGQLRADYIKNRDLWGHGGLK